MAKYVGDLSRGALFSYITERVSHVITQLVCSSPNHIRKRWGSIESASRFIEPSRQHWKTLGSISRSTAIVIITVLLQSRTTSHLFQNKPLQEQPRPRPKQKSLTSPAFCGRLLSHWV
jgi:hypothetical protein